MVPIESSRVGLLESRCLEDFIKTVELEHTQIGQKLTQLEGTHPLSGRLHQDG